MSYKSLNLKISIILVVFGAFLLTILFVLIVPKMEKERLNHSTKQIENMINLTTYQIKLATKAIQESGENRKYYTKSLLETKVENIHHKLESLKKSEKQNYLAKTAKTLNCNLYIVNKNKNILFQSSNKYLDKNYIEDETWNIIEEKKQTVCPKPAKQIIYSKNFHTNDDMLVLNCNPKILSGSINLEYKLKKDIQHSFSLTNDMHKGKIYLMWIDINKAKNSSVPLYQTNDDRYYNNKYCVSKISNLDFPKTGLLTGKEILNAIDKAPIKHFLDKKGDSGHYIYPAITWVKSIEQSKDRNLLFITTILEEDFHSNEDSSFWKILPTSLLALFTAILVGLFIFRRLFNTMNILTDTAKEINEGNLNVRSNIRGKDDIGLLGTTFDNMLDTIEKDIEVLDNKVAKRTNELQTSLDEKEILLREIHHRVKNNLAMTIELIKIQKIKIKDSTTKIALGDIQERIHVMELLHRKLYESKNLSSINITKYVNELVYDISMSYMENKNIKINVNIDKSYLMDIEYALPCGLIINECLTNSLKYAFKEDKGEVNILLIKENEYFILKINDNGKGIEKSINIKTSKTLGLRLISSIVRGQLLGTIEYENNNGASFIIKFKF
mgnify:CR=1 FL=1